jgi:hypothetical protein
MNTMGPNARTSTRGKLTLPMIFAMVLLALVFIGVLPSSRGIDKARASIEELQADLQQQKALLPIYLSLQQRQKKSLPEGISVNQLQPFKIDDLAGLPDVFETLARESEVELVSATPQVRSLQDGREMLRIDARLRGEFLAFNILLNRLNEMRFVESIESLTIDVTNLGHEMSLAVWLAIQSHFERK